MINKKQLSSLRKSKEIMIYMIILIAIASIWIKVGLNPLWHLNDVVVELLSLFIIIFMGIMSNIKNNFPIFNIRNHKITKEFAYSITSLFTMTFIFVIYQNIVQPDFISYIAGLSFHDLCTLIVFIIPIIFIMILLIYFSFMLIGTDFEKKKIIKYDNKIERSMNRYKVLSIKSVYLLSLISIWIKVGLNDTFSISSILYEVIIFIVISMIYIIANLKNKLKPFHNFQLEIDKTFIYSIILPYTIIIIYAILNTNFRLDLMILSAKELIALFIYICPIFFFASMLFYLGCKKPKFYKKMFVKENRLAINAILSLLITIIIMIFIFLYAKGNYNFSAENILQTIVVFLPISVIIYLIIFNGLKEINK